MKLSGARLFVRELTEARQFYAVVVGLKLKHDGSKFGYCVFDAGEIELVSVAAKIKAARPMKHCRQLSQASAGFGRKICSVI